MDSYDKLRQLFYYKVRHGLLKLRQVLQSAMNLLQIARGIYYKVRWLLQIATLQGFP